MLFTMVVSLLFIATAAANMAWDMDYESGMDRIWDPPEPLDYEPGRISPEPHFSNRYDYYDYVIERIQSHSHGIIRIIPYDGRVAQIISGNFPGLADGYNSDRLQDLINDFRTRV